MFVGQSHLAEVKYMGQLHEYDVAEQVKVGLHSVVEEHEYPYSFEGTFENLL